MEDTETVSKSFEEQSYGDGLYVRCLCLRASVVMDFASSNINGLSGPLRDVTKAINELQKAQMLAEEDCCCSRLYRGGLQSYLYPHRKQYQQEHILLPNSTSLHDSPAKCPEFVCQAHCKFERLQ